MQLNPEALIAVGACTRMDHSESFRPGSMAGLSLGLEVVGRRGVWEDAKDHLELFCPQFFFFFLVIIQGQKGPRDVNVQIIQNTYNE